MCIRGKTRILPLFFFLKLIFKIIFYISTRYILFSCTLLLFFLSILLIVLNPNSISLASVRTGYYLQSQNPNSAFLVPEVHFGLYCVTSDCGRLNLSVACSHLDCLSQGTGSVPSCKCCGLCKSLASGMSIAAPSCFTKSRTGSSFNFFVFLAYFRTSQKHAVLLCFIERSLLIFSYCLLGTSFQGE